MDNSHFHFYENKRKDNIFSNYYCISILDNHDYDYFVLNFSFIDISV